MMDLVVSQNNPLMPQSFEEKFKMSTTLAKSGLLPQGLNTPEKVCVALQWGHELGLSPMVAVNNVAVINGKPTLSADIMAAVVKRSPEYGGIEWLELSDKRAACKITRILPNGAKESIQSSFSMDDAAKAGLAGRDVWKKYPRRMLKHRCLSYGLKDMFPDLLAGLYTPEEMESVPTERDAEENHENARENHENVIAAHEVTVSDVPPAEACDMPPEDEQKTTRQEKVENDGNDRRLAASINLESLLNNHGIDLRQKNAKVQPYTMAKNCLDNPNSTADELEAMYQRCVSFLERKGIKVA